MELKNKLLAIAVLLSLLFTFGCKDDDDNPPPAEIPGEELAGTWSAVRDDAISGPNDEVEAQFVDFALIINVTTSGVTYTTTGNGDKTVFPDNGSFSNVDVNDNFTSGASVVRQPDNIPMKATVSDNGNTLALVFTIDTQDASMQSGNVRIEGIDGEYEFMLDKQ